MTVAHSTHRKYRLHGLCANALLAYIQEMRREPSVKILRSVHNWVSRMLLYSQNKTHRSPSIETISTVRLKSCVPFDRISLPLKVSYFWGIYTCTTERVSAPPRRRTMKVAAIHATLRRGQRSGSSSGSSSFPL
jgi:hypothetical protein